jgi:hypothetical protein
MNTESPAPSFHQWIRFCGTPEKIT